MLKDYRRRPVCYVMHPRQKDIRNEFGLGGFSRKFNKTDKKFIVLIMFNIYFKLYNFYII